MACAGRIILQLLPDGVQVTVTKASHAADIIRQRDIKGNIQPLKVSIQTPVVSAMEQLIIALAPGLQYQHLVSQVMDMPTVRDVRLVVRLEAVRI